MVEFDGLRGQSCGDLRSIKGRSGIDGRFAEAEYAHANRGILTLLPYLRAELAWPPPLAGPVSRPWRSIPAFQRAGADRSWLVIGAVWVGLSDSARIQREAVAAIEQAGGLVRYDWEWNNGKSDSGRKTWHRGGS